MTTEKLARRIALEFLNKNRSEDGKPPVKRIEALWWRIHGPEFMEKAVFTEKRMKG